MNSTRRMLLGRLLPALFVLILPSPSPAADPPAEKTQAVAAGKGAEEEKDKAESGPPLEWVNALWIFVISGAVGGMLATLRLIDVAALFKSAIEAKRARRDRALRFGGVLFLNALGGVGGAAAVLFFLVLDSKVNVTDGNRSRLLYVTEGFIAGFIGLQLLNLAAGALIKAAEKTAGDVAKETAGQVAKETVGQAAKDAAGQFATQAGAAIEQQVADATKHELIETKRELAILHGRQAQADGASEEDVRVAEERLRSALQAEPGNRRLTIVLGNLLARKRGLPAAIEFLTQGAVTHKTLWPDAKVNQGAIHYNLAYYCWRLSEDDPAKKDEFRRTAFVHLRESVSLDRSNAAFARADEDFQSLWGDAEFLGATQPEPAPAATAPAAARNASAVAAGTAPAAPAQAAPAAGAAKPTSPLTPPG